MRGIIGRTPFGVTHRGIRSGSLGIGASRIGAQRFGIGPQRSDAAQRFRSGSLPLRRSGRSGRSGRNDSARAGAERSADACRTASNRVEPRRMSLCVKTLHYESAEVV